MINNFDILVYDRVIILYYRLLMSLEILQRNTKHIYSNDTIVNDIRNVFILLLIPLIKKRNDNNRRKYYLYNAFF